MSVEYGTAFDLWRKSCAAEWYAYTRHPFVEGLRTGSLPREAFTHYQIQDYLFLKHFSRAWGFAVVKSDTLDEMKVAAAAVDALVNTEMQLHVKTCAEVGVTEDDLANAAEDSANMAYTRYVLDAGLSGDLADLLSALAPCVLGYGEIGARLGQDREPGTIYGHWIDTYAGDDYQDLCHNVGALIDRALSRRIGPDFTASPRWTSLCDRFAVASRLESGFWQLSFDHA